MDHAAGVWYVCPQILARVHGWRLNSFFSGYLNEDFYVESSHGSPPNVTLTESPVLEPGPGRISGNTGPVPPRRHRSIFLCKQENP